MTTAPLSPDLPKLPPPPPPPASHHHTNAPAFLTHPRKRAAPTGRPALLTLALLTLVVMWCVDLIYLFLVRFGERTFGWQDLDLVPPIPFFYDMSVANLVLIPLIGTVLAYLYATWNDRARKKRKRRRTERRRRSGRGSRTVEQQSNPTSTPNGAV